MTASALRIRKRADCRQQGMPRVARQGRPYDGVFSAHTKKAHLAVSLFRCFVWCRHQESNSGPTDYKSVALPTELYRRYGRRVYRDVLACKPLISDYFHGICCNAGAIGVAGVFKALAWPQKISKFGHYALVNPNSNNVPLSSLLTRTSPSCKRMIERTIASPKPPESPGSARDGSIR